MKQVQESTEMKSKEEDLEIKRTISARHGDTHL
jgi:hypothetical protein